MTRRKRAPGSVVQPSTAEHRTGRDRTCEFLHDLLSRSLAKYWKKKHKALLQALERKVR